MRIFSLSLEESDSTGHPALQRTDSTESTSSEHEFLKQYEIVTHRMIQRKCSVEMYKRIANRTFGYWLRQGLWNR
ncbi:UNVERIFIED_CONTAM: hypothetical protein NCL1_17650 [Trichonephila clavipes]